MHNASAVSLSVLDLPQEAPCKPSSSVRATTGARAEIHRQGNREMLRLVDGEGHLLIEHDVAAGRTVVVAPSGDLQLRAPAGAINMEAAHGIQCSSAGMIALESLSGVCVRSTDGQRAAGVTAVAGHVALTGERVDVAAKRGRIAIDAAQLIGSRWTAKLSRARLLADKVETVAERAVVKAKSLYHTIEGLHQVRAGRMRSLIEAAFELRAGNIRACARGNVHIDGKQINLG